MWAAIVAAAAAAAAAADEGAWVREVLSPSLAPVDLGASGLGAVAREEVLPGAVLVHVHERHMITAERAHRTTGVREFLAALDPPAEAHVATADR